MKKFYCNKYLIYFLKLNKNLTVLLIRKFFSMFSGVIYNVEPRGIDRKTGVKRGGLLSNMSCGSCVDKEQTSLEIFSGTNDNNIIFVNISV